MTDVPRSAATLREWLAPFPSTIADALQRWSDPSTTLIPPDPQQAQFRLDPYTHLPRLAATLDDLRRSAPDPGRVIGFFDSRDHQGLDATDVRVVLDGWMAVEAVHTAAMGEGVERTVAAGVLRHDYLGLTFRLGWQNLQQLSASATALDALERAGLIPAVLFMRAGLARVMTGAQFLPLVRTIRRLAELGTIPGLVIGARQPAVDSIARQADVLRRLWRRDDSDLVLHFRHARQPDAPPIVAHAARAARASFDASAGAPAEGPFGGAVREGAYYRGAYLPQPFDLRTPSGQSQGSLIELPLIPVDAGLAAAWEANRPDLVRLARLLDYFRLESYLRRPDDVGLAQRYHDFRIYNWNTHDAPVRTMLADGGAVTAGAATRLVDDLHRMRELGGRRFHDAPGEFFAAARTEAASRVGRVSALQIQSEEHHYLEAIPRDAPLRADVLWFLDGLPQQLGRTLELGAGYGRLAQELSPRAARYVCVDLDPGMMRDLSRAARQYGLVADIHALPFASGQFETIVANNVLEHAYDPVRAFSEIKRVLAAGGELHALIPLDALNTRHRLPAHLWKADLENIPAAARMAGLAVEACDPINIYSLAVAGSFPSCDGWICRLRARAVQKES